MSEGRPFDGYVEEYRAAADETELQVLDEYADAFRLANQILTERRRTGRSLNLDLRFVAASSTPEGS